MLCRLQPPEYSQRKGKTQVEKLSLSEIKANLYPNPNKGSMILEYDLDKEIKGEMRIFDITGKLVNTYILQNTIGKIEINEENLMNGVYYYSIQINNNVAKTDKIIIRLNRFYLCF